MFADIRGRRDETVFLPSLALAWTPAADLLVYARYQEGFRPGGVAVTTPFVARVVEGNVVAQPAFGTPITMVSVGRFENDDVATIEAGVRYGRPGAGTFDVALAFAYTDWTDIQADIIDLLGFQTTSNIGDGRVYTIDARAGWRPLPGLNIEAAAVFNDSLVTNPAPSIIITPSSPLPNVARFNGFLGIDYLADIGRDYTLRLWSSARYAGTSRLGIGPILGEKQGDWLDIGAGARLERGRHAFTFALTNLTDEVGNRFAMGSPFVLALRQQITPLRPRTLRVGWEIRF
jgi:outer membrane receptor protein involved in Fe transport